VARTGPRWGEIGDLAEVVAVDTIDATGLFLHADTGEEGIIRRGEPAVLTARAGREADSQVVLTVGTDN
jgi:hypothetical protein